MLMGATLLGPQENTRRRAIRIPKKKFGSRIERIASELVCRNHRVHRRKTLEEASIGFEETCCVSTVPA